MISRFKKDNKGFATIPMILMMFMFLVILSMGVIAVASTEVYYQTVKNSIDEALLSSEVTDIVEQSFYGNLVIPKNNTGIGGFNNAKLTFTRCLKTALNLDDNMVAQGNILVGKVDILEYTVYNYYKQRVVGEYVYNNMVTEIKYIFNPNTGTSSTSDEVVLSTDATVTPVTVNGRRITRTTVKATIGFSLRVFSPGAMGKTIPKTITSWVSVY